MSAPLRVLVVDDEPLARQALRLLLEGDAELALVGECSGKDAEEAIARTRPDLLLLDIEMPEVDGFELLQRIGVERAPTVVFVTAHAQHALRAFEVHALDYLLKPVDDARFASALARAKAAARARAAGSADPRLSAFLAAQGRYARRFLVRTRDHVRVVDVETIDWIGAADYYAELHVGGETHLLRETMNELEGRLDPARFFRVHRSAIIHLARVREIHPLFRGDCDLVLADGSRVRLSRTRRAEFERLVTAPPDRPR